MLETFLVDISRKSFQFFCSILNDVSSIKKVLSLQCSFQLRKRVKPTGSRSGGREVAAVLSQCSLLEVLEQNRLLCWSIVVREKPNDGAPSFGTFSCDRIPKATKDAIVHLYIQFYNLCHAASIVNYTNEFRERV